VGAALAAGLVVVAAIVAFAIQDRGERVDEHQTVPPPVGLLETAVKRVVLDPGHGGQDPGARAGELSEASLVLDVALRLETRLEAETGIDVMLTRRDDVYLPLEARTRLANGVDADLFLSIHANASRDRLVGGIATYHLGRSSGQARRAGAVPEVGAAGARLDASRDLAALVQRYMIRGLRTLHPEARDLGVKRERFEVLIGATMPSVLTEISFVTNQAEAALLATDAYRDRISDALFEAIVEYQPVPSSPPAVVADN
jgi:N-acetylmuramoyl-L-alanine amidase